MPIETNNLVIRASQRLTDNDDGGGLDSGRVVVDGEMNNLFDDISELNWATGNVSMRKAFAVVNTNDTDKLMGATLFVAKRPLDPNVSATLFSTGSHTDRRADAKNRVENYVSKGGVIAGALMGDHKIGMRVLQVCMGISENPISVGTTILLSANESQQNQFEQYLRVTRVDVRKSSFSINQQSIDYNIVNYTVNDSLAYDFTGITAPQWYGGIKQATTLRDSIVADTGRYYTSVNLTADAGVGDFVVQGESIFTQIVPTSQAETPLANMTAVGENSALIKGSTKAAALSTNIMVSTTQAVYLGSSIMPSSLDFDLFGQAINDQGGILRSNNGLQVGTVDYQRGIIQWTENAGTGQTQIEFNFVPAAAVNRPMYSDSLPVTQNNQSSNWSGIITPLPTPGSLIISFMAQGKYYDLKDDGTGQLSGSSTSFGHGFIDYATGVWSLSAGALPDVNSVIFLFWNSPIATFERSGLPVLPAKVNFDLEQTGIIPSNFLVTWILNGEEKTATCNNLGQISGDAIGAVNFSNGLGYLIPNQLPQKGTQFNFSFQFGESKTQNLGTTPSLDGELRFKIGAGIALQPNSIDLLIPLRDMSNVSKIAHIGLRDNGIGGLIDVFGQQQGVVDYATGDVVVTPYIKMNDYYYKKPPNGFVWDFSLGIYVKPTSTTNTNYQTSENPWADYRGV